MTAPLVVIACRVFEGLLEAHLPEEPPAAFYYQDYGLHRHPRKLTQALQGLIDSIEQPSRITLGYGLCGNGLDGLRAGRHTLLIPRADDCIALLLGSPEEYRRQFETAPGTYYLTKGWLESGSDPLKEFEENRQKYGDEEAEWIMDQQYQHYTRLALVAHNQNDLQMYRPLAKAVADYCQRWGMQYEEILGHEGFIQKLARAAVDPTYTHDDILIVHPGETLQADQFRR
ncbi:MAG: DUF1638 domain-containing protein [Anaerolineales bacterium]|jgi:hypothetical protein